MGIETLLRKGGRKEGASRARKDADEYGPSYDKQWVRSSSFRRRRLLTGGPTAGDMGTCRLWDGGKCRRESVGSPRDAVWQTWLLCSLQVGASRR